MLFSKLSTIFIYIHRLYPIVILYKFYSENGKVIYLSQLQTKYNRLIQVTASKHSSGEEDTLLWSVSPLRNK